MAEADPPSPWSATDRSSWRLVNKMPYLFEALKVLSCVLFSAQLLLALRLWQSINDHALKVDRVTDMQAFLQNATNFRTVWSVAGNCSSQTDLSLDNSAFCVYFSRKVGTSHFFLLKVLFLYRTLAQDQLCFVPMKRRLQCLPFVGLIAKFAWLKATLCDWYGIDSRLNCACSWGGGVHVGWGVQFCPTMTTTVGYVCFTKYFSCFLKIWIVNFAI